MGSIRIKKKCVFQLIIYVSNAPPLDRFWNFGFVPPQKLKINHNFWEMMYCILLLLFVCSFKPSFVNFGLKKSSLSSWCPVAYPIVDVVVNTTISLPYGTVQDYCASLEMIPACASWQTCRKRTSRAHLTGLDKWSIIQYNLYKPNTYPSIKKRVIIFL